MKKKIILLSVFFVFSFNLFSQRIDKIIKTQIYTSYFSYTTHTPLFVIYELYHGGGNCSRSDMSFQTEAQLYSATKQDYESSGYDIGHMANAEDFAFDCSKEEITFRFYNALPQTPKLNRGTWKTLELKIRKESKQDSILIICGGYNFNKKIGQCSVPDYCYKIIKDLKTKQISYYLFPNDNSDSFKQVSTINLLKIPYDISLITKALK
jgi:endonuclease G